MQRIKVIISLFIIVVIVLPCVACGGYVSETRTIFSSGIVFSVSLYGGDEESAINDMVACIDEIDVALNTNRADSFISKFNSSKSGEITEVDYNVYYLATVSKNIYLKTDGAFDPTLAMVSKLWEVDTDGINKYAYGDFEKDSLPDIEDVKSLAGKSGMNSFVATEADGKYYLTKTEDDVTLDFGGVAKGYLADRCKQICKSHGIISGLINISGNIYLIGDYFEGGDYKAWGVGVVNPRNSEGKSAYVCGFYEKGDTSIVTSGDYERCYYYKYGNESLRICHIIDGKTAMPIGIDYDTIGSKYVELPHIISATIIGESSMLCDAYATAACVMNVSSAVSFLEYVGYRALIFTSDGKFAKVGEFEFSSNETLYLTEYSPL